MGLAACWIFACSQKAAATSKKSALWGVPERYPSATPTQQLVNLHPKIIQNFFFFSMVDCSHAGRGFRSRQHCSSGLSQGWQGRCAVLRGSRRESQVSIPSISRVLLQNQNCVASFTFTLTQLPHVADLEFYLTL